MARMTSIIGTVTRGTDVIVLVALEQMETAPDVARHA